MSAVSTAFSIVELHQEILSRLPPFDIILCQRVNSTWRKLINDSPLLQYKSWLRNDYPDSAYHVRADDLMHENNNYNRNPEMNYRNTRFHYNISKHLNPIVVARIMEHPPVDPSYCFDPLSDMDKDGFGGYLNFTPLLLRDLRRWYDKHKDTEHIWGNMSLYRPDARAARWEIPISGGAGIPFRLEAVQSEESDPEARRTNYFSHNFQLRKRPGQALILRLSDLMATLDLAWREWIESETEEHYLSHDGGVCDFDQGIPSERCLVSDDEDDEEEQGDEEEGEKFTSGCKMTMEEHIEQAMLAASS